MSDAFVGLLLTIVIFYQTSFVYACGNSAVPFEKTESFDVMLDEPKFRFRQFEWVLSLEYFDLSDFSIVSR
jgi:hypothetical protein